MELEHPSAVFQPGYVVRRGQRSFTRFGSENCEIIVSNGKHLQHHHSSELHSLRSRELRSRLGSNLLLNIRTASASGIHFFVRDIYWLC